MIRINLLPVRAAKKKETVKVQLTLAGIITCVVFVVSIAVYLTVRSEASSLQDNISRGQNEITELKKKIGELSRIKEQKKIVEEKLAIITNLEAARTGPTKLFKMIGASIPERAWLSSVKEESGAIVIKGHAVSDEVVADLMRGLQRYKELGRVELEVAERRVERETNAELVGFSIRLEKEKEKDRKKEKK
ncbi:MAG: PilN domain-containing protein [Deltaproteobacteria bacterium]|nr:PilN domain-containing protein [Deltaproteobacteria bacterium]